MNKDLAQYQMGLNMVNQTTPMGSITYSPLEDDPNRWQSEVSLTPEGQAAFDLNQQVSTALNKLALQGTKQLAGTIGGNINTKGLDKLSGVNMPAFDASDLPAGPTSIDFSNLTDMPEGLDYSSLGDLPTYDTDAAQRAEDAYYSQLTRTMDPFYERDLQNLENRLINSGMQVNSPGYNKAIEDWRRARDEAYGQAREKSITGGLDYGTQLFENQLAGRQQGAGELENVFGTDLALRKQGQTEAQDIYSTQAAARERAFTELARAAGINLTQQQAKAAIALANRQQQFSEEAYKHNLPLNEISTLMGVGNIAMPQFGPPPQTGVAGTDLVGATYSSANMAQQQWQQQQAQRNALLSGLFDLGGSALGGWAYGGFA
jgi:hypothetical protein